MIKAELLICLLKSTHRPDDLIQPFRIDPFALRGRLVRLGPTVDRILSQHDYPEPVAAILGEAITLAVVLAGTSNTTASLRCRPRATGRCG